MPITKQSVILSIASTLVAGVGAVILTDVAATAAPAPTPIRACTIDVDKELWIRDLSVVEDPLRTTYVANPTNPSQGVWTFGRLMENMAGNNDPSDFVLHLFKQFLDVQVVNGFAIDPRPGMFDTIIQPWIDQSHANGFKGLDFSIAPFRLNGFVNRIDLRTNATYGGASSAGEGRIVFSVLLPDGSATLFTLILEYALIADSCEEVKRWASDWHALGQLPFGEQYNRALEKLVNRFAGKNAAPGRPNGSAINQVRTNELVGEFPWQWREFQLSASTLFLEQSTVAQTIQTILNRSTQLRDYVNQNEAAILNGTHVVPLTFQTRPFRGGSSDGDEPNFLTAHFRAKGINNNNARHLFSLNNCVACHTEETGTSFFHSSPRSAGQVTFLSGFLTGTSLPDPVVPTVTRTFNDLKRRVESMCKVLEGSCSELDSELPLNRVH